jgi:hypothetical protein
MYNFLNGTGLRMKRLQFPPPVGYKSVKAYAKRHGLRVNDCFVLSPQNDPFYCGSPAQRRDAEWFVEIWKRFHYTNNIHIRRIHYRIISQEREGQVILPHNGKVYENTERCFDVLNNASKYARYLELVDPAAFIDKRNPEVLINRYGRLEDPEVFIEQSTMAELPDVSSWYPSWPRYSVNDCYVGEQRYVLEVWCEKSTMDDILVPLCRRYEANLQIGVGELSYIKASEFVNRVKSLGKPIRLFYISDFDPGGQSMPVAVARKVEFDLRTKYSDLDIRIEALMLTVDQVKEFHLPRTPIKEKEKRKTKFEERYGEGAVELDALEALHPGVFGRIVEDALKVYYDDGLDLQVRIARDHFNNKLAKIHQNVISAHQDEVDRVLERHKKIAEEFKQRIQSYNDDVSKLSDQIEEELIEQCPDIDDYPIPEAKEVVESNDVLFDSKRDYYTQLKAYKKFQGK